MKKVIVACLALVLSTGAFAQEKQDRMHHTPAEKAQMMTNKMTKKLGLSEDQKQKVQAINLTSATKMRALRPDAAARQVKMDQMKAVETEREASLKNVLNGQQMADYMSMKAAQKDKTKDRMKNHKEGMKTQGKRSEN